MLERGWLEEVAGLARNGVPFAAKPFDFIGYSELRAHLEGTITLASAKKAISQATRHYAKRQLTWFRKEPLFRWVDVSQIPSEDLLDQIAGDYSSSAPTL